MDDTMSDESTLFDASLPTPYSHNWRSAERLTDYAPRYASYQAPGGSPLVFILEGFDFSGGQSVDTAEYPFGGSWSHERLNEKPQVLHIKGSLRGPEYITRRNTLIESLRVSTSDDTPGFMDLPFWGRFPVVILEYQVSEKLDEKGQCSVTIDCKRAGVSLTERAEEKSSRGTTPEAAAQAVQAAAVKDFKEKLAEENLDTNTLVQGFMKIRSALLAILGRVQAAQTLLNGITSTINDISSLIAQGIRGPEELARAFFNSMASIFGGLLEIKNSVESYENIASYENSGASRGTTGGLPRYPAPANTSEKAVVIQCLAAHTYTLNIPAATAQQQKTQEAIEQCYRIGAWYLASQIITQMSVLSYQTATRYWTLLEQLEESIDKDNTLVYAAIEELRISVSRELAEKELSAEVHRTFMAPLPLLAMAQYVGCDADKLQELNRVADSFVITGEVAYV
jgi:hypothetical protein